MDWLWTEEAAALQQAITIPPTRSRPGTAGRGWRSRDGPTRPRRTVEAALSPLQKPNCTAATLSFNQRRRLLDGAHPIYHLLPERALGRLGWCRLLACQMMSFVTARPCTALHPSIHPTRSDSSCPASARLLLRWRYDACSHVHPPQGGCQCWVVVPRHGRWMAGRARPREGGRVLRAWQWGPYQPCRHV